MRCSGGREAQFLWFSEFLTWEMPAQHTLVKQLLKSWNEISMTEVKT
jgi:hypothetical protein